VALATAFLLGIPFMRGAGAHESSPRRPRGRRLATVVRLAGVALALLALPAHAWRAGGEESTWLLSLAAYDAAIPDDVVLQEQLHEAIELRRREDFDRVLDARDPGELLEHATLTEAMFEGASFGVDVLFVVGDELFGYLFRPENGWGSGADRLAPDGTPRRRRVHRGPAGGPDAFACMSCHFKGGPDGAGMQTQNAFLRGDGKRVGRADERNPPHLLGLGPVEALAREMSAELQAQAAAAVVRARAEGARVEQPLASKGVSFGRVAADPDGTLHHGGLEGVDPDLTVRPFGWKGHQATLRDMVEESFHLHQGLLSMRIQHAVREGTLAAAPYGAGKVWHDLDGDGVSFEIDSGMLTTMVGYLAQLEAPVMRPPRDPGLLDAFAAGRTHFDTIGCAGCHVPTLELEDPKLDARLERGVETKGPPLVIDLAKDGEMPKIEPKYAGPSTPYLVHLFSDLKRHDMGDALATAGPQGTIPARVFLTRPLWGLADTAPYLHDGRAPTVHDAIVLHGGEAAAARDAYLALDEPARASVRVFLASLSRAPKLFVP
jgi:hypothetical protein